MATLNQTIGQKAKDFFGKSLKIVNGEPTVEIPPIVIQGRKPSLAGVGKAVEKATRSSEDLKTKLTKKEAADQATRVKDAKIGIAKDIFGVGLTLSDARDKRRDAFRSREAQDNIFQQRIAFDEQVSDAEFRQQQATTNSAATLAAIQAFRSGDVVDSVARSGLQIQDTSEIT